ncbi:LysR family transcriptional regulator [Acinetobacter gerneri]|jgi:DNA-binding transcriptional LysR family regulator|uniref:LysR family transcriptional regulator n=1 Tax=Acinetobacter gerneri TaxID=202952 RepID=A0AAW8JDX7_9GAMM|nr:LysR family transcriptional regulator [Acinetobacter gerneri]MCH4242810.1 LysR family transcriptional regulator [Acinetobacter gerneri]MDQ9008237.1 LysR family transcriptional regulator [Acinetobacter gerneri]MDQ9012349.1 LysR family transcriptional regulator [Acinetobacter gerneri]MDQ9023776.1 LysR family transcriptional regulator [Acinetobacter gerneri]MDQ9051262.1 LysR family transcriptional regulator [Acinetobacter gerneri]
MNTEDFQFFIRVADLGSITQAAKHDNISVSVASQRIQRLEQQLNIRLFHRTTRKLKLTDEGKILLAQGRTWIKQFLTLHESLIVQDQKLTGTLKLTASATFGMQVLTAVIADFSLLYPELKIHLDLNDQNQDLIANGIDLAIRIGKLQDSSLVAKRLTQNNRLLCASPAYLERFGIPKSIQELQKHRCILQQHAQGLTDTWDFAQADGSTLSVAIEGYFISNSGEAIRQASLKGLGISNHSIWHVEQDLKTGKLIQVLEDFPIQSTAIYAVIADRNYVPAKVRIFLEYLENYFKNQYAWYR